MSKVQVFTVETWLGPVYGAVSSAGVCALSLPSHDVRHFAELLDRRCPGADAVNVEARRLLAGQQVAEYFARRGRALDAPVDMSGLTSFAQAVMERLRLVPYGQTITYGQLAAEAGRPGAARAVGQIMHHNPVPLFLPCHRVLGSSGALTGFGAGIETKKALLEMESDTLPFPPPNKRSQFKGQSRGGSK